MASNCVSIGTGHCTGTATGKPRLYTAARNGRALRDMRTYIRGYLFVAALPLAVLAACASSPGPAPVDPSGTAAGFAARRLEQLAPEQPLPAAGWNRAQWLSAALQFNPQLAEARSRVAAAAAAERTAPQHTNPTMNLFAEYVGAAA